MRGVLHKALACVLAAGLIVAGPACAHAQMDPCASETSHEAHAVQHYADLNVDPGDEASSDQVTSGVAHHHDDGLCKKCCAVCLGATLIPSSPAAVWVSSELRSLVIAGDNTLIARVVPTEPGIPKPL